jgi:Leucine-rich repeat (LRR) protein
MFFASVIRYLIFGSQVLVLFSFSELHMSRNQLTSIPNEFSNLTNKLRVISFEYNFFKSMPQQFYLCDKLEELNFSANEIGKIDQYT